MHICDRNSKTCQKNRAWTNLQSRTKIRKDNYCSSLYICHTKAMTTLFEYGTRCLYDDTNFYSVLIVRSASMGVSRIFSRGDKVVKFVFSLSKLRIQPVFAKKFQNPGEGQGTPCPPFDARVCILIKSDKFLFSEMLRRKLLSVCQAYAQSHGNIFNCSKTVCMTFKTKSAKSTVTPLLTNGW